VTSAAPRRSVNLSIALVALIYLLTLLALEKRAFWITDNANKFLQVRALLASSYTDYSIPWPGAGIDPEFRYNPLPAPFSVVRDGKLYSQYPPLFALLSSLPYRWFGFPGLYLLPAAFSVLTLIGVARLAALVEPRAGPLAVWLAGVCTPLWFYAVVFWEHAIALCFCVWAIRFHVRFRTTRALRDQLAGAVLAAGAVWFREELILLGLILVAFVFLDARKGKWTAALTSLGSLLAAIAPLALFQWKTLGDPLGFHISSNLTGLSEHLGARPAVFYNLLVSAGSSLPVSLAIAAPFLIGFLVNPRLTPPAFFRLYPWLGLIASATGVVALAGLVTGSGPIAHLLQANSLFPAAPILLLGLVRPRWSAGAEPDVERLWLLALGFALAYALVAPEISTSGIHWGNRFLLPVYPLLAIAAAVNLVRWRGASRWGAVALASTIALSLAAQVASIRILDLKKTHTLASNRALERHTEPAVITNVWWAPQALAPGFYERPVFFVRSRAQLETLKVRLQDAGYDAFVFVTRATDRPAGASVIDDLGLRFFSLAFTSAPTNVPGPALIRLRLAGDLDCEQHPAAASPCSR